jgi:aminoglycoside phosphotransferase (APT) family kinase protein
VSWSPPAELAPEGEIVDARRLSGGASRETWSFDVLRPDGSRLPRILQRTRRGTGASLPMTTEADLLRAARAAGVPCPEVISSGAAEPLDGPWMLVDRVEGETIARRILRDDRHAAARSALVGDSARALAALHAMDPATVTGLPGADPFTQLRSLVDAMPEPHPALELGFRWLGANRPDPVEPRVVHGDFRLGNVVVGPEGLASVLDWELAHTGDPREDLGWLCVRAWRFGAEPPVAGLGGYDELFTAYEEASGTPLDRDAVRWWELFGCLRWGVICMLQASVHLSGAARSVELATIGRRTCEAEYDLMLGLAPLLGLEVAP